MSNRFPAPCPRSKMISATHTWRGYAGFNFPGFKGTFAGAAWQSGSASSFAVGDLALSAYTPPGGEAIIAPNASTTSPAPPVYLVFVCIHAFTVSAAGTDPQTDTANWSLYNFNDYNGDALYANGQTGYPLDAQQANGTRQLWGNGIGLSGSWLAGSPQPMYLQLEITDDLSGLAGLSGGPGTDVITRTWTVNKYNGAVTGPVTSPTPSSGETGWMFPALQYATPPSWTQPLLVSLTASASELAFTFGYLTGPNAGSNFASATDAWAAPSGNTYSYTITGLTAGLSYTITLHDSYTSDWTINGIDQGAIPSGRSFANAVFTATGATAVLTVTTLSSATGTHVGVSGGPTWFSIQQYVYDLFTYVQTIALSSEYSQSNAIAEATTLLSGNASSQSAQFAALNWGQQAACAFDSSGTGSVDVANSPLGNTTTEGTVCSAGAPGGTTATAAGGYAKLAVSGAGQTSLALSAALIDVCGAYCVKTFHCTAGTPIVDCSAGSVDGYSPVTLSVPSLPAGETAVLTYLYPNLTCV